MLHPVALAIAVACFLLFIIGPLVAVGGLLATANWDVSVPVTLGAVAFVTLIGWSMSSSVHWVELDGWVIRGKRLFTRKVFELQVADIVEAHGIHTQPMGPLENAVLDFMLQTRDRGFVLIFRDGSKIPLSKTDMSGLDAFMGQLAAQMKVLRTQAERTQLG